MLIDGEGRDSQQYHNYGYKQEFEKQKAFLFMHVLLSDRYLATA
jgi:hypothetical protein